MKVLRNFPSAHFRQTPFSPSSKTVRVLNLDWSASLGVPRTLVDLCCTFMCLPAGHFVCLPWWHFVRWLQRWHMGLMPFPPLICVFYLSLLWSPTLLVPWRFLAPSCLHGFAGALDGFWCGILALMFDSHLPLKGKGPGAGGSFEGSSFESCINLCWSLLGWYLTECGSLGTDPLGRIRPLVTLFLCLGSAGSGASANTSFFQRLNGCLFFLGGWRWGKSW